MKIVKIGGGLGNQMFQYAFALSLERRWPGEVSLDSSSLEADTVHNGFELGELFSISLPEAPAAEVDRLSVRPAGYLSRLRRKYFTKRTHIIDKKFGYQGELLDRPGELYYEGYWQSEKYFEALEGAVRSGFSFRKALSDRNLELLRELPRPIASIHVRRGDYLKYPNLNICTPEYYKRALGHLAETERIASFIVLSDDADYCRRELDLGGARAVFADWNQGGESWQDMALMSRCDHHIIANSSFSWWGAWLNKSPQKRVIAPRPWNRREVETSDRYYSFTFGDIVPETWERVAI